MSQLLEELLRGGELRPQGVLHLGAEWCQEAGLYGDADVLWAEASAENLPKARAALAAYPRQKLVHAAVWHTDGLTVDFHIYNARSSNSLFVNQDMQKWYPRHEVVRTESVRTVTVDRLLQDHWSAATSPSLLVMDLQGAELHALTGAGRLLADPALRHVCTEAVTEPLYRGGTLLEQLDELLTAYGFRRVRQQRHEVSVWYPEIAERIGRGELADIPQFDVLYCR